MFITVPGCKVHKNIEHYKNCGYIANYGTRNAAKLYIPRSNLAQVDLGFFITSNRIYNHLHDCIKINLNHNVFKSNLKYFKKSYFSVDILAALFNPMVSLL